MGLPYFPFYPKDWLADTSVAQLTLEEQGAYFKLLCHLWQSKDGACALPNDDRVLSLILGVRIDVWRRLSVRLKTVLSFADKHVTSERLRDIREKSDKKLAKVPQKSAESPTKTPSLEDFSAPDSSNSVGLAIADPPYKSESESESYLELQLQRQSDAALPPDSSPPIWPSSLEWCRSIVIRVATPYGAGDIAFWDDPVFWARVERLVDSWGDDLATPFADELAATFAEFLDYWANRYSKRKDRKATFINRVKKWHDFRLGKQRATVNATKQRSIEYPGAQRR